MRKCLTALLLSVKLLFPALAKAAVAPVVGVAKQVRKTGLVSWYGLAHEGKRMANGKPFRRFALTAASRTLPLGTHIRVTNIDNNRYVVVVITDRGPFKRHRILDLSEAAARQLGIIRQGIARVMYVIVPDVVVE